MTDLKERRVLVAGGTGDVGEAIVRALLGRGAMVIVPARNTEKAGRLREALEDISRLTIIEGEVGDPASAVDIASRVRQSDQLHGVVASLGGWWQGQSLADVNPATWERVIADNLKSHYAVARAFVPLLRETGGTYVQLLGGAANYPVPGSSLMSITAAAVAMMGRSLEVESEGAFRMRQILINALVATRSRPQGSQTGITADQIGSVAADLIADTSSTAPLTTVLPADAVQPRRETHNGPK